MTRLPATLALLALASPAPAAPLSAQMISAAKAAPLAAIDYDQDRCDGRTVREWLAALTKPQARAIDWTSGRCRIVGRGIDSGSRWCVQATVRLAAPKAPDDAPMVEIFFEAPKGGRPGPAYAFRGRMRTPEGLDITRFRADFEADWTSRFRPSEGAIVNCAEP